MDEALLQKLRKRQEQTLHDFDVNALIIVELARHRGPKKPMLNPCEAVFGLRLKKGQEVVTVTGISIRRDALVVKRRNLFLKLFVDDFSSRVHVLFAEVIHRAGQQLTMIRRSELRKREFAAAGGGRKAEERKAEEEGEPPILPFVVMSCTLRRVDVMSSPGGA